MRLRYSFHARYGPSQKCTPLVHFWLPKVDTLVAKSGPPWLKVAPSMSTRPFLSPVQIFRDRPCSKVLDMWTDWLLMLYLLCSKLKNRVWEMVDCWSHRIVWQRKRRTNSRLRLLLYLLVLPLLHKGTVNITEAVALQNKGMLWYQGFIFFLGGRNVNVGNRHRCTSVHPVPLGFVDFMKF